MGLDKTHATDAFVIAGGNELGRRAKTLFIKQGRRNNRCLQVWYDAKYIDTRTNEKVAANVLNNGRRARNKNTNTENLRKYRGKKVSFGHVNLRLSRSWFQPGDTVIHQSQKLTVTGMHCHLTRVILKETGKSVKAELVKPYRFCKGLVYA